MIILTGREVLLLIYSTISEQLDASLKGFRGDHWDVMIILNGGNVLFLQLDAP